MIYTCNIHSILMQESELIVRRIREGTVIDHIEEGKGLQVLDALGIDGKDGAQITIALNVPSAKYKKKDIIKSRLPLDRGTAAPTRASSRRKCW